MVAGKRHQRPSRSSTGREGELAGVGWTRQAVEEAEGIKGAEEDSEGPGAKLAELAASTRPLSPATPLEGATVAAVEEGMDRPDTKTAC